MSSCKTCILTLVMVSAMVIFSRPCPAGTVVVLPMEDLSQGSNGLNMAITQQISRELDEQGFQVATPAEVLTFMVRNRVRWLGHLGSHYVRRLKEQLNADYLVLGSVNQRYDQKPYVLGLSLQVVRTRDWQIVWSRSVGLSGADEVGLLGLSPVGSMEDLERLVVRSALSDFSADLENVSRPVELREGIDSVFLTPTVLKPGEDVFCRIKLDADPSTYFNTEVSIFVDERIIKADYRQEENSFIANWPAPVINDRYQVAVQISRPGEHDKEFLVGTYLVDGEQPDIDLDLKGQELNGIVVLQKKVTIMPVLKNPEPIKRWEMTVRDEEGAVVMHDDGRNGLPDRFSWWGQGKSGSLVNDGYYTIGLTVWDRAGNKSNAEQDIRVIRKEPQMVLAMEEQKDTVALSLEYEGDVPLAYWRLEIQNQEGKVISESSGTEQTEKLHLALANVEAQKISYRLFAQDMLGNRLRKEMTPLVPAVPPDEEEAADNGDFLADAENNKVALKETWAEDF